MKSPFLHRLPLGALAVAAAVLGVTGLHAATTSSISEPDTVLYGKVFDRSGGVARQLFSGRLECSLRRESDGHEFVIEGEVAPLPGGLSYRLGLPHQAAGEGLFTSSESAPLTGEEVVFRITSARFAGSQAYLLPPATPAFRASQLLRASAHRLDFEVTVGLQDSDGDGMPDWWEEQFGLDPLGASDAFADADGDGLTNLAEFLAGSNPLQSDRAPSLADARLIYYPGVVSGVYLQASDSDTPAGELRFQLITLPAVGELTMRGAAGEEILEAGATFAGADLEGGRLLFHSDAAGAESTSFRVRVTDDTPGHAPDEALIKLEPYLESEAGERSPRAEIALSSAPGAVIWDIDSLGLPAVIRPVSMPGEPSFDCVFLGGAAADIFAGGDGSDLFFGGQGEDTFTGGAGADRFGLLPGPAGAGTDRVSDFSMTEGDRVDLRHAIAGSSVVLEDYVRLSRDGAGLRFSIDADGEGDAYADAALVLEGAEIPGELAILWEKGLLLLPEGIAPATVVSLEGVQLAAGENGAVGTLRLRRIGALSGPLTVFFRVAGSATNGVDFAYLGESFTFAAGQASLEVVVEPLADALSEEPEVVDVALVPGPGYTVLAGSGEARVTIADLMPEFTLKPLEPMATLNPSMSGYAVLTRTGALHESVLARFRVGGDAVAGSDYFAFPPFVDLLAGQRSRLIEVLPIPGADLGAGRVVRLSLESDPSYLIGGSRTAEIAIVPRRMSLSSWRETHFPDEAGMPLSAFAQGVSPSGMTHLEAYALGQIDSTRAPLRVLRREGETLVEYRRVLGVGDVDYRLEMSKDLRVWTPAEGAMQRLWPVDLAPGAVLYGASEVGGEAYFRINLNLK